MQKIEIGSFEWLKMCDRFFSKIEKTNSCWNWSAQIYPSGYGAFYMNSKNTLSHRASWVIHFGEIPKGMLVCHACDNPKCVNPDHLWLGTHKENTNDMIVKGRKKIMPAKIDHDFHKCVFDLYLKGFNQRDIAKKFSVHQKTIWRILHTFIDVRKNILGENNPLNKLKKTEVLEIRNEYARTRKIIGLSEKFNVSRGCIENIIYRRSWKHI